MSDKENKQRGMIEYVARIDLAKHPEAAAGSGAVPMTAFGIRMGFANAVLHARGFFAENSIARPDLAQHPRPLLTWPFLDFLSTVDVSAIDLVELGAGNSTLAFAGIFRRVTAYENNQAWLDVLAGRLPANASLKYFAGETLDPATVDVQAGDWLLVDFAGKRTRFLKQLLALKRPADLPVAIVLDNSDWYRNGARLLAAAGYAEIPFFGMKSGQTWISCTSLFIIPERTRLVMVGQRRLAFSPCRSQCRCSACEPSRTCRESDFSSSRTRQPRGPRSSVFRTPDHTNGKTRASSARRSRRADRVVMPR
jgi:hypothetical protein